MYFLTLQLYGIFYYISIIFSTKLQAFDEIGVNFDDFRLKWVKRAPVSKSTLFDTGVNHAKRIGIIHMAAEKFRVKNIQNSRGGKQT